MASCKPLAFRRMTAGDCVISLASLALDRCERVVLAKYNHWEKRLWCFPPPVFGKFFMHSMDCSHEPRRRSDDCLPASCQSPAVDEGQPALSPMLGEAGHCLHCDTPSVAVCSTHFNDYSWLPAGLLNNATTLKLSRAVLKSNLCSIVTIGASQELQPATMSSRPTNSRLSTAPSSIKPRQLVRLRCRPMPLHFSSFLVKSPLLTWLRIGK